MAFMLEHCTSIGWIVIRQKVKGILNQALRFVLLALASPFKNKSSFSLMLKLNRDKFKASPLIATLRSIAVRKLSQLAGFIISRAHCLGPPSRMRTRAIYSNIEERLKTS